MPREEAGQPGNPCSDHSLLWSQFVKATNFLHAYDIMSMWVYAFHVYIRISVCIELQINKFFTFIF